MHGRLGFPGESSYIYNVERLSTTFKNKRLCQKLKKLEKLLEKEMLNSL